MKTLQYIPYQGGAGPSKEQADNNTLYLGQELKKYNIPFSEDHEWAEELWGGDDLNLKIEKGGEIIYVGYDRWGFVIDNTPELEINQEDLMTTIHWIINWYQS